MKTPIRRKRICALRVQKVEKDFRPKYRRLLQESIGRKDLLLFVGDTLYVYFDKYRDHRYGAVRSLDHGETWEDVSDQVSFPRGIRHGTAFAVDASVVEALIANRTYNPLIPDNVADPSVSKFGDTYYLYGTTDLDYGLERAGTPVVWKSKDFVNWSFEGSHISGFDWSKGYEYTNDKGEKKKDISGIGLPESD